MIAHTLFAASLFAAEGPDLTSTITVYSSFALLVAGGGWLIKHLLFDAKNTRAEFLTSLNTLGEKHAASLDKTVSEFRQVTSEQRQETREIGEKVDTLAEKVHGLDCQRAQRNGKPSC